MTLAEAAGATTWPDVALMAVVGAVIVAALWVFGRWFR